MFSSKFIRMNLTLPRIARRYLRKEVALISCPFGGGQTKAGTEKFPEMMKENGIVAKIESLGRKVTDYGSVEVPEYSDNIVYYGGSELRNAMECGIVSERLAALVEQAARDDKVCVTIGGDRSTSTGSLIGQCRARKDVCVIWVDAHMDINTHESTLTGNLHGMPLSFVVKGLADVTGIPGYEWTKPCLSPNNLAYIGLRDIDPMEYDFALELGMPVYSMHEVDHYGIAEVMERVVDRLNPRRNKYIHISFDVNSIDAMFCPGTGIQVPGGLTLRESLYIGEYVNKLGVLAGIDITEVNPLLCKSQAAVELTMDTATAVIESCLGRHRPGYVQ